MNILRCIVFLFGISSAIGLHARSGYSFSMVSVNYLQQYDFGGGFYSGAELLYDRGSLNCITRTPYFAAGVSGTWSANFNEYGIKTCWGSSRWIWNMSRMFRANPYFFAQVNYKQQRSAESAADWNFRPGIGFSSMTRSVKGWCIRFGMQAGYTIGDKFLPANKHIILEGRIGIGFGVRAKQKKTDTL